MLNAGEKVERGTLNGGRRGSAWDVAQWDVRRETCASGDVCESAHSAGSVQAGCGPVRKLVVRHLVKQA